MKDKLDGGDKIIKYLSFKGKQLKWSNLDSICDNLAKKWVETNNYKVCFVNYANVSFLDKVFIKKIVFLAL